MRSKRATRLLYTVASSPALRKARYVTPCAFCGGVLVVCPSGNTGSKYHKCSKDFCDIDCANQYKRLAYLQNSCGPRARQRFGYRVCTRCKQPHSGDNLLCRRCTKSAAIRKRESQRETRVRPCKLCGTHFSFRCLKTAAKGRLYCSSACSRSAHNTPSEATRRKAYKEGERIGTIRIAVRDNWICRRCGVKCIRPTGKNLPNEATLDHILPLSKGGTHTWLNAQLLCRECNTRKVDTVSIEDAFAIAANFHRECTAASK